MNVAYFDAFFSSIRLKSNILSESEIRKRTRASVCTRLIKKRKKNEPRLSR